MNERILELADEVDKWFKEDGHSYSRPAWNEKFAELIVRECAGVNYNSAFKDGEFCAREVLDHFGVEE